LSHLNAAIFYTSKPLEKRRVTDQQSPPDSDDRQRWEAWNFAVNDVAQVRFGTADLFRRFTHREHVLIVEGHDLHRRIDRLAQYGFAVFSRQLIPLIT
jgi:hypothetical protein